MVQDPLCGTWVPLGQAVLLEAKREKHYFCSPECRQVSRKEEQLVLVIVLVLAED